MHSEDVGTDGRLIYKLILSKKVCDCVHCIHLAWDVFQWLAFMNAIVDLWISLSKWNLLRGVS